MTSNFINMERAMLTIMCRKEGEELERVETGARNRRAQSEPEHFTYSYVYTSPQYLNISQHAGVQVSIEELCKRFSSDVSDGLTEDQVQKSIRLQPLIT